MTNKEMRIVAAENIRRLLRVGESMGLPSSQAELARHAGIAQTSISAWLDPDRTVEPRIGNLNAIANVYGLDPWQMLVPNLTDDMVLASHLKKLVANYRKIGDARAREYIDRVAEAEAHYHPSARRDHEDR